MVGVSRSTNRLRFRRPTDSSAQPPADRRAATIAVGRTRPVANRRRRESAAPCREQKPAGSVHSSGSTASSLWMIRAPGGAPATSNFQMSSPTRRRIAAHSFGGWLAPPSSARCAAHCSRYARRPAQSSIRSSPARSTPTFDGPGRSGFGATAPVSQLRRLNSRAGTGSACGQPMAD